MYDICIFVMCPKVLIPLTKDIKKYAWWWQTGQQFSVSHWYHDSFFSGIAVNWLYWYEDSSLSSMVLCHYFSVYINIIIVTLLRLTGSHHMTNKESSHNLTSLMLCCFCCLFPQSLLCSCDIMEFGKVRSRYIS